MWGATAGIAIAVGPIAGGWLLERYLVAGDVPRDGAGRHPRRSCSSRGYVPTSRDPRRPVDASASCCPTAAMAPLVYTIIEAPSHGWTAAAPSAVRRQPPSCVAGFIV